jgi:hypothetical protein
VPADARSVSINAEGEVYAYFADRVEPEMLGQFTLAGFSNPKGLEAMGSNLYLETPASGPSFVATPGQDGLGTLRQGYLEESSVDAVKEVTDLIEAQRGYELNSKVIQRRGATSSRPDGPREAGPLSSCDVSLHGLADLGTSDLVALEVVSEGLSYQLAVGPETAVHPADLPKHVGRDHHEPRSSAETARRAAAARRAVSASASTAVRRPKAWASSSRAISMRARRRASSVASRPARRSIQPSQRRSTPARIVRSVARASAARAWRAASRAAT